MIGGEHEARTPIPFDNSVWAADLIVDADDGDDDDGSQEWQWRLIKNNPSSSSSTSTSTSSPPLRIAHAQAVHNNQHVYIFGGRAGVDMNESAMRDLWKLDCSGPPGSETWSEVTYHPRHRMNIPEARSFHKMICVGDSLFVSCGCGAGKSGRLNDLYKFDIDIDGNGSGGNGSGGNGNGSGGQWHLLGKSGLRGRGGPNLLSLASGTKIGIVAGFAGEETNDGHVYDLKKQQWDSNADNVPLLTDHLKGMRPRSVCASASFSSLGCSVVFGGEVDPSDRGHEGAGGFENDIVILDEGTGAYVTTIAAPASASDGDGDESSSAFWPKQRGWSDAAGIVKSGDGSEARTRTGLFYVFGGLSGDDVSPERLDDLIVLVIRKEV